MCRATTTTMEAPLTTSKQMKWVLQMHALSTLDKVSTHDSLMVPINDVEPMDIVNASSTTTRSTTSGRSYQFGYDTISSNPGLARPLILQVGLPSTIFSTTMISGGTSTWNL